MQPPHQRALRRGRRSIAGGCHVVTTVTSGRERPFEDFDVGRRVAHIIDRGAFRRDSEVLCWVLMPDHLHALVQIGESDDLSRLVSRLKRAAAAAANAAQTTSGRVWQRGFHDRAVRREADLRRCARYIVLNPVRADLVRCVGMYPFWNAIWL